MKALVYFTAGIALALAGSASAAPKQQTLADVLFQDQASKPAEGVPPGQMKRADDPDRGDDRASSKAIDRVCGSSTPAAQRSAICNGGPPASP